MDDRLCQTHLISFFDESTSLLDKGDCVKGLQSYKPYGLAPHTALNEKITTL